MWIVAESFGTARYFEDLSDGFEPPDCILTVPSPEHVQWFVGGNTLVYHALRNSNTFPRELLGRFETRISRHGNITEDDS